MREGGRGKYKKNEWCNLGELAHLQISMNWRAEVPDFYELRPTLRLPKSIPMLLDHKTQLSLLPKCYFFFTSGETINCSWKIDFFYIDMERRRENLLPGGEAAFIDRLVNNWLLIIALSKSCQLCWKIKCKNFNAAKPRNCKEKECTSQMCQICTYNVPIGNTVSLSLSFSFRVDLIDGRARKRTHIRREKELNFFSYLMRRRWSGWSRSRERWFEAGDKMVKSGT